MTRRDDDLHIQDQKIRQRLASRVFWEEIVFFVVGTLFGYLILASISPIFYEREDKERIRYLESLSQEYLARNQIKLHLDTQNEIEKVKEKYPTPISPLLVLFGDKYGKQKPIYFALSFLPLLLGFFLAYQIKKYREKTDQFFYQYADKEPPLSLPKELKYAFFFHDKNKEFIQKTFKNPRELQVIMNGGLATSFDENLARKVISETISQVLEHAREFYPFIPEKEYAFYLEVLLWHYLISLNGNVPTGLMAVYIQSPTLKKMLSLYQRRLLPLLYRYGEVDKEELKPYVYLRCFYEACERFKLLDKFNPLDPLKSHS